MCLGFPGSFNSQRSFFPLPEQNCLSLLRLNSFFSRSCKTPKTRMTT